MKVQVISDLHLEFGMTQLSFQKADVVVLAGDVHVKTGGIEWILESIKDVPVIYVLGNHEYYKGSYPKTLKKIKELALGTNVHVLENESVNFDGVTFHGATLWTDFSLFGNPRDYGIICQQAMNDYKKIRVDPAYSKLRSVDTFRIHKESVRWLKSSLELSESAFNVVVTHHAPSQKSIPYVFKDDPVSSAYASDLEELIEQYSPDYWIHGHIHEPKNYMIGRTQVLCNPRGYVGEPHNGYKEELLLDMPSQIKS